MTEQTQETVKRKVDKIRKMLDNAGFEDKRFLLDSLDVQVKVDYQNGQRGLWVTCGIKVDADWLPFEYQAS